MRGMFRGVFDEADFDNLPKRWMVELTDTQMLWPDELAAKPLGVDVKRHVRRQLKEWKERVAQEGDKCFIYFLASRTRVRFSLRRKPRYAWFSKRLILWLEVGQARRLVKISRRIFDANGDQTVSVPVHVTPTHITFGTMERGMTQSIHAFLFDVEEALNIPTVVHYVGCTQNPEDRVLKGKHTGWTRMLRQISNEENDFLLFQHLFQPHSLASMPRAGLHLCASNTMLDTTKIRAEGWIIEKALIAYFEGLAQTDQLPVERVQLRNVMRKENIERVRVDIQYIQPNEYFAYGSAAVPFAVQHQVTITLNGETLEVDREIHPMTHEDTWGAGAQHPGPLVIING